MARSYEDELEEIKRAHDGQLHPEDVVEFAKDEQTQLHARFDWDDTEAAKKWRLDQAGRLIRAVYKAIENELNGPVLIRAYVSLPSDRRDGSGYRTVEDVLTNEVRTAEALQDLLSELRALRRKYNIFRKLAGAIGTLDRAISEIETGRPN